jgi:hypothetical protein
MGSWRSYARRDVPERLHQRSLVDLETPEIGMIEMLSSSHSIPPAAGAVTPRSNHSA